MLYGYAAMYCMPLTSICPYVHISISPYPLDLYRMTLECTTGCSDISYVYTVVHMGAAQVLSMLRIGNIMVSSPYPIPSMFMT